MAFNIVDRAPGDKPPGGRPIRLKTISSRIVDCDIELRAIRPRDAIDLYGLIERHGDYLRRWMPWLDDAESLSDIMAFIQAAEAMQGDSQGMQLGVWYRHVLAGLAGFNRINWMNRQADMGYWLGEGFQGRGIMTRVCRHLVRMAFDDMDLHRIQIMCAPGNTRSRAIPERLGFRQEGILREAEWLYDHFEDSVLYSLLATDPSPS